MTRTDRARFWNEHLAHQRRSGLSRRAYCAQYELGLSSFRYWSRKQCVSTLDVSAVAPRLVPVELLSEPPAAVTGAAPSGVQLHSGALRIELAVGFDVPTLRRTLEALGC